MKKYLPLFIIILVLAVIAVFICLENDDARMERAEKAVKAVLYENPEAMTALAEELIRSETDEQHYQYYPADNILCLFDGSSAYPVGQLKEHAILDTARFLAGNKTFDLVSTSKGDYAVAAAHCEFWKAVTDWKGNYLFILKLIYCAEPFEENKYAPLEKLLPNWYLYYMPCV